MVCFGPHSTENATANGDTRTIYLHHSHTGEDIAATFRKDGVYDRSVLAQLNHFLRDWRNDDETNMDPRLFDVIWETYRESGSRQPIWVVSAYRSPVTNAMLRRRSKAVAEHSQHMLGKAMDMHYQDVPMSRIRELGMRLQRGGVGYYPTSGTPFVHLDVGSVRYWPRMNYDQLARLFPDGKAVFMAADGRTLPRYEEARAEIMARGQDYVAVADSGRKSKGFFASLFGGGGNDDDEGDEAQAPTRRSKVASLGQATGIGPRTPEADSTDSRAAFAVAQANRATAAKAEQNLPRGETFMGTPQQTAAAARDLAAGITPLPPRRPSEFAMVAAALASAPLPPTRPAQLAALAVSPEPMARSSNALASASKTDAIGRILADAPQPVLANLRPSLPSVITQGSSTPANAPPPSPGPALAYAPSGNSVYERAVVRTAAVARVNAPVLSRTIGLRAAAAAPHRAALVAARLDRSNFDGLTSSSSVATTPLHSTLGATLVPLRAAARMDAVSVGFASVAMLPSAFDRDPEIPGTDGFTGPAVKSFARN